MTRFLFRTLTQEPPRGLALFQSVVADTRQAHWFVEGGVPDTLDGRFAVLATLLALTTLRLQGAQDVPGECETALHERFIEAMDAEHRQLGIGDPTLGKVVRKLVTSLARRVDLWHAAMQVGDWSGATRQSLFDQRTVDEAALRHCEHALRAYWQRLADCSGPDLVAGRIV